MSDALDFLVQQHQYFDACVHFFKSKFESIFTLSGFGGRNPTRSAQAGQIFSAQEQHALFHRTVSGMQGGGTIYEKTYIWEYPC